MKVKEGAGEVSNPLMNQLRTELREEEKREEEEGEGRCRRGKQSVYESVEDRAEGGRGRKRKVKEDAGEASIPFMNQLRTEQREEEGGRGR